MRIVLISLTTFLLGIALAISSWIGLSNIVYEPSKMAPATAFLAGFLFAFALHESLNTAKHWIVRCISVIGVIVAASLLLWSLEATVSTQAPPPGPVLPSDSANRIDIPVDNQENKDKKNTSDGLNI